VETAGNRRERKFQSGRRLKSFYHRLAGLSEHLNWQLSVTICSALCAKFADNIIGIWTRMAI